MVWNGYSKLSNFLGFWTGYLRVYTQNVSPQRRGEDPTGAVQMSWGLCQGYEAPEMERRPHRCCTDVLGFLPGK